MPRTDETPARTVTIDEPAAYGAWPAADRGAARGGGSPTLVVRRTQSLRAGSAPGQAWRGKAPTIFDRLEIEWGRWASTTEAAVAVGRWAEAEPVLAGPTPADIVRAVTWLGYRPSAGAEVVLSALLRLSADPMAARTLLQALLPRLRAERVLTPTYGHGVGESWRRPDDTVADLVAECFSAIKRHAGEDRAAVDRLLVAEAARRLRTARQAQRRYHSRTSTLADAGPTGAIGQLTSARSDAEWLAEALVEAVRSGALGAQQAQLVYATRVKGWPASEVARRQGLAPGAVYYALQNAERALVASVKREPAA